MHGNRVAAMELRPVTIAGADCRAHHAAGTNCGAYLAGTVYHIYLAGADTDCRAHRAAGTNCGAYLAGTGCRA